MSELIPVLIMTFLHFIGLLNNSFYKISLGICLGSILTFSVLSSPVELNSLMISTALVGSYLICFFTNKRGVELLSFLLCGVYTGTDPFTIVLLSLIIINYFISKVENIILQLLILTIAAFSSAPFAELGFIAISSVLAILTSDRVKTDVVKDVIRIILQAVLLISLISGYGNQGQEFVYLLTGIMGLNVLRLGVWRSLHKEMFHLNRLLLISMLIVFTFYSGMVWAYAIVASLILFFDRFELAEKKLIHLLEYVTIFLMLSCVTDLKYLYYTFLGIAAVWVFIQQITLYLRQREYEV